MKKLMKSVLACTLAFAMVLTVMPVNTYAANKKAVVVTNQKQLEKALKNGATNIVIKTNKNVKITIPASKKAAKASISVQAKNATITNKASVKSIEIKDAKAFVESGKNNDIKITDSKLSLIVSKASKGADIQVAKKDADIKVVAKGDVASVTVAKTANVVLTVNKTAKVDSVNVAARGASVDLNAKGTVSDVKVSEKAADTKLNINASGKVENVQIDAKADVAVAGSTTEAVKVTVNAKDTTIKAETAVETTLNADAKVDLSKGAEGSTVTTAENVKVDVANNTADKVTVTDSTGKETSVDAGKTETTKDESKKDDEKKDDQKKDDQSSGSVASAPTSTPLRIGSAIIWSSTEVRVYFNQTVPNEIATDQVVITDKTGNAVSVEKVERGNPDTQAYFVTLSNNALKDGEYKVELTISNQKFVTSFLYEENVWAPLDAALEIVNKEFAKTHTVSVSGLESAEICRQAFEKDLMAEIDKDTEAKKVQVKVETRNFEYEPDEGETIADNHKMVCIWIGLYMGESTKYMTDEFVDFECTGAAIEAKAPEIIGVTKTSIIVKAENGQEYIALDKNADISKVDDESWYGFDRADSNGNIEIKELESDITYVVYTRIHGLSPKAAENEISLSKAEGVFVVFKNCNISLDGTVSYDEQSNELKLNIPFIVNDVASFYGDEDCEGRILVKNSAGLTLELESFIENEIQFNLCEKPSAKEYNITFQYVVIVGDNEVGIGEKEFTAHFTITQEDLNKIQEEQ